MPPMSIGPKGPGAERIGAEFGGSGISISPIPPMPVVPIVM